MSNFNYQYKDRRLDETLVCVSETTSAILDYVFCSTHAHRQITSINQQYLFP